MPIRMTELIDLSALTPDEIQARWEDAYQRFETEDEEISKFVRRLNTLGQRDWPRDAKIVDIFSGRCNGIRALENLGFRNLEGVDISPALVAQYSGDAVVHVADCRQLPFSDASRDIIIVQGGLHHLERLPDDLDRTLSEIGRVLRPGGKFVMVEPWRTPFLDAVHFLSDRKLVRMVSNKFDAFATMAHYEQKTYYNSLGRPSEIRALLENKFKPLLAKEGWGKLFFVGEPV